LNTAGAGKTVLRWILILPPSILSEDKTFSSTVVKGLFSKEKLIKAEIEKSPSLAVAFFYFDFRNKEAQSVETALRRIVLQLSAHSPTPHKALDDHYESSNGQKLPSYEELCEILRHLIRQLGRTYIVLDALDECDEGDFNQLVDLISMLRDWTETPLHLFITSQSRRTFTECFRGMPCIALGFDSTRQDIKFFVASEIRSNPKLKIWRGQANQITDRVARKSKGM
jgi:hypothetical protein